MAAKVFLSYSHKDGEFAAKLHARLKADGVEVFYDKESIQWGANWVLAIEEALETCEYLLVVLSRSFVESEWGSGVERVVSTIKDASARKRRIRPLLLADCKLPGLLTPIQYLDVRSDKLFDQAYPTIREAFGGKSPAVAQFDRSQLPPIQLLPPGSNLPHRSLGSRFVGRVEDLWALHDLLIQQNTAIVQGVGVVYGTGGLGKTQLAIEYGYRFAPQYPGGVLWADAEQGRGGVLTQLSAAKQIEIDGRQEEGQQMLQLWQALAGQGTLVILDNFPEEEALEPYLPRSGGVQALVTTRRRDLDRYNPLRLEFLSDAAALELLNSGAGRTFTDEEAQPLLEALGGLPLALELARALLHQRTDLMPADLAEELAQMGEMQVLDDFAKEYRNELPTGHEKGVAATFQVSWNLLDEPARELLRALADLAPMPVPMRLLREIVPNNSGSARKAPLEKALAMLHRLSLIEREPETNDPVVHRLTLAFARAALPENELFPATVEALREEMKRASLTQADLLAYEELETILPHAWLVAHRAQADPDDRSQILDRIGIHHQLHGRYRQGVGALRDALRLGEAAYGPGHPEVATSQSNLAVVLVGMGELSEARDLLRAALQNGIARSGPGHPSVATRQSNLAMVLKDLREFSEARDLLRAALQSNVARYGPEHLSVTALQSNLATVLLELDELSEARDLLRAALQSDLARYGPGHPSIAMSQSNLAVVLLGMGEPSDARDLLRAALQSALAHFEPDHPNIAICRGNLAGVLADLGEQDEARKLTRQAYGVFLRKLGPAHPYTRTSAGHMRKLGLEPPAE